MSDTRNPLTGPPPAEVPLTKPPLVRVIAQVRFPVIASVEKRDFIASFQEAVRQEYPVLRPEKSLVIGEEGMDAQAKTAWRFHNPSNDWSLTLTSDFLALDTRRYGSRNEFLEKFHRVLEALEAQVDPKAIDRVGIRYIDRIEDLSELPSLVRPELSGILTTPLREEAHYSMTETVLGLPDEEGLVTARWGLIPARGTIDPSVVEPIDHPSWILDLDAFQTFKPDPQTFEVDSVIAQTRRFAERVYSIFRWAVTDEFLSHYGGKS